jgi:post-segregation antitoxin (ccd killing protein)
VDKAYPTRSAGYDLKAAKQTVSVTINSDLYAQAKSLGINTSQVAEEALAREVATRKAQRVKEEIRQDLDALDAYEAKHGSFAEMVRDHYQSANDDEAS